MDTPLGSANIQNLLILGTLQCDFFFLKIQIFLRILAVEALFVIVQENGKGSAKAQKVKLTVV